MVGMVELSHSAGANAGFEAVDEASDSVGVVGFLIEAIVSIMHKGCTRMAYVEVNRV